MVGSSGHMQHPPVDVPGAQDDTLGLLARLQMIAATFAGMLTAEELTAVALAQGIASVGAAGAVLYLCRGNRLHLVGSIGFEGSLAGWEVLSLDARLPLTDALRDGAPVWLPTAAEKQARYPVLAAARSGYHATASLPLVSGGRRRGALGVAFTGERDFAPAERLFLLALSDHLATAIGRLDGTTVPSTAHGRVPPSRRSPARRTLGPAVPVPSTAGLSWDGLEDPARLAVVDRLLDVAGSARVALDRFARTAAAVCAAPRACLSLLDRGRVVVGEHTGLPQAPAVDDALCLLTAAADGPVSISDTALDDRAAHLDDAHGRAFLGVPLRCAGLVVGTLYVTDPEPRAWPDEVVGLLVDVAAGAAEHLEVRAARHRADASVVRAARLLELSESAASADSAAILARVAVSHLAAVPGVVGAAIVLIPDEDAERAGVETRQIVAAEGLSEEAAARSTHDDGWTAADGPVTAPDAVAVLSTFAGLAPDTLALGVRAMAAWPLRSPGRAGGVLVAARTGDDAAAAAGLVADMIAIVARQLERVEVVEHIEALRTEAALLVEASRQLEQGLDAEQTLARAARVAVPGIAGQCVLHLNDDGMLRPVAVAHVDAHAEPELWTRERRAVHPSAPGSAAGFGLAATAAATGRIARRSADASAEAAWAVAAPLVVRGRTLGVISLAQAGPVSAGTPPRTAFVGALAQRVGVAIDNALLYQQRDEAAQALARRLLPPSLPDVPGVELAALYRPADTELGIGGDFFDAIERPDGSLAVVIGDVCGRGAEAAGITAIARHTLRVVLEDGAMPAAALQRLNRTLMASTLGYERLTTAAVAVLRPGGLRGDLVVGSAGHPLPVLVRRGRAPVEIGVPSILLGAVAAPQIRETTVEVDAGDTLVAYTDGVTEARGRAGMLGTNGLLETLDGVAGLPAEQALDRVGDVLAAYDRCGHDDVAVLAIRLSGRQVADVRIMPDRDVRAVAAAALDTVAPVDAAEVARAVGELAALAGPDGWCRLTVHRLADRTRVETRLGPPGAVRDSAGAGLADALRGLDRAGRRGGPLTGADTGFWCEAQGFEEAGRG